MSALRRLARLALLSPVVLVPGCSDATAPEPDALYALTRVDGEPLPVTRSHPSGIAILRADSLRILDGRRYTRTTVLDIAQSSFLQAGPTETGILRAHGDRFILDAECPDLAICVAPDTIRFSGDGAEILGSYVLEGADLRYRRSR